MGEWTIGKLGLDIFPCLEAQNHMQNVPEISISIVSHGQGDLVRRLLKSIQDHEPLVTYEIILTENLLEKSASISDIDGNGIRKIINEKSKSFAANHNQAFRIAQGKFFCILNPDVIFVEDIISPLIENVRQGIGEVVAPIVKDSANRVQDSFRPLPSPREFLFRGIIRKSEVIPYPDSKYIYPDWVAGIFLLLRSDSFHQLGGFDERYKMYFEDVDFSLRARLRGMRLLINSSYSITHDAARFSRRRPKYILQHLLSALIFYRSTVYRQAKHLGSATESNSLQR